MNETEAVIERVKRVSPTAQQLEMAVEEPLLKIKPGQSLLARVDKNSWHPYLRERWWPVAMTKGKLVIERPIEERYDPGQIVHVMGLVGQPYRFRKTLRNVLLVAYDSAPTPLMMMIPWLVGNKISVTIVLLGAAQEYLTQHLPAEVEIIHGDKTDDTLSWNNQVMTVGWADQVFTVVAQDDEFLRFQQLLQRFRDLRADVPSQYLFGVFQQAIPCGTGACHACMIPMQKGGPLACLEGPAFDLTQVTLPT